MVKNQIRHGCSKKRPEKFSDQLDQLFTEVFTLEQT